MEERKVIEIHNIMKAKLKKNQVSHHTVKSRKFLFQDQEKGNVGEKCR